MDVLHKDKNNHIGFFYPPRPDMDDFEKRIKEGPFYNLEKSPEWRKYNIIGGHFTFGIHDVLKTESFKYIGVVREPIQHYISTYRAFLRMGDDYKDYLLPGSKSIENMLSLKFLHNMQTFFLSGLSIEEIRKDKERAYQTVIENSEEHFAGVYPTERFDEGLFYFKNKIGIRPLCYSKKNVAKNRVEEISESLRERIIEVNDVDVRLYEYFSKKFRDDFNSIPLANFQVKWFKIMNVVYGWRGHNL